MPMKVRCFQRSARWHGRRNETLRATVAHRYGVIAMKQPETASKPLTPFFARKVADAPLVVRSGVRAGLAEQDNKVGAREQNRK